MRESEIERFAKKEFEKLGCLFLKWTCPGHAGVPDRILILPDGQTWFVELKNEVGRLSGLQKKMLSELATRQQRTYVLYSKQQVSELVEKCRAELHNEVAHDNDKISGPPLPAGGDK